MRTVISNINFDDTLSLTECTTGWWLYDTTRGMNLSMRAKSKEDAFFEALKYYQERLIKVEKTNRNLQLKVDNFISQFINNDNK